MAKPANEVNAAAKETGACDVSSRFNNLKRASESATNAVPINPKKPPNPMVK